jgi:ribosomal-protein-alanine N-acetyltransferase
VTRPPVREATPADRPAVAALQSLLPERAPALLDYALEAGPAFVTADSGAVVGYLLAVPGDGAHVAELAVAPDARREGRATALLGALFDRVDGPVTVAVAPGNDAALALYESVGFERRRRLEGAFESGDALLLRRPSGRP